MLSSVLYSRTLVSICSSWTHVSRAKGKGTEAVLGNGVLTDRDMLPYGGIIKRLTDSVGAVVHKMSVSHPLVIESLQEDMSRQAGRKEENKRGLTSHCL